MKMRLLNTLLLFLPLPGLCAGDVLVEEAFVETSGTNNADYVAAAVGSVTNPEMEENHLAIWLTPTSSGPYTSSAATNGGETTISKSHSGDSDSLPIGCNVFTTTDSPPDFANHVHFDTQLMPNPAGANSSMFIVVGSSVDGNYVFKGRLKFIAGTGLGTTAKVLVKKNTASDEWDELYSKLNTGNISGSKMLIQQLDSAIHLIYDENAEMNKFVIRIVLSQGSVVLVEDEHDYFPN